MNDFSELERELKQLRPAPVSPELAGRIERLLAADNAPTAGVLPRPQRRGSFWWSLGAVLSGLAAILVIGVIFLDQTPTTVSPPVAANTPTATSGFEPVGLTQVVYDGHDDGVVFLPNDPGAPRRRLRYETRETVRWRNPQTGASVRLSYPAEQVVLRPVSFQ